MGGAWALIKLEFCAAFGWDAQWRTMDGKYKGELASNLMKLSFLLAK
jgi:hypothetical protein